MAAIETKGGVENTDGDYRNLKLRNGIRRKRLDVICRPSV